MVKGKYFCTYTRVLDGSLRGILFFTGKIILKLLPFSQAFKERTIEKAVDIYKVLLGWTGRRRLKMDIKSIDIAFPEGASSFPTHESDKYIPYEEKTNLEFSPYLVKIIAFYLPQFHAIPENDIWWGEGFTEWTNVKPAKPQFEGHYQPRIPGELGYYNLLDRKTQKRQVELAKNYGIGGFCFHFYWFGGKRLLERPILQYLQDTDLDLPFCLCWANENWSRRWDGRELDVLISQTHSSEDDLAFISYVSQYLEDPRYIRINGKPLLIIYRPEVLPDAKATVSRWRNWYRSQGLDELYIACTHSFGTFDPKVYDMDAALEFPPNNSGAVLAGRVVKPLCSNFQSVLYDWRSLVARSLDYQTPTYPLFRGVCPSWDNTARRKHKGTVFLYSSPSLFQYWLQNAIGDTIRRFDAPDERLIFVNAWNEWAEGAYLEPDDRYGYAYLEAVWKALDSKETYTTLSN